MRVAPVALFCYDSTEALIDTARQTARITHAHREGYNGAILQVRSRPGCPVSQLCHESYSGDTAVDGQAIYYLVMCDTSPDSRRPSGRVGFVV